MGIALPFEHLAKHHGNMRSADCEHFRRNAAAFIGRTGDGAGLRSEQPIHAGQKCRHRCWLGSEIDDVWCHANHIRSIPYFDESDNYYFEKAFARWRETQEIFTPPMTA